MNRTIVFRRRDLYNTFEEANRPVGPLHVIVGADTSVSADPQIRESLTPSARRNRQAQSRPS
jgi:hypothetical protein